MGQSVRPFDVEELCHALGIEENSKELDPENVLAIETLLSCCLGLVTIGVEGSRFRLIHLTLPEYLDGPPDLFGSAHSKMADVCFTYPNFQTLMIYHRTLSPFCFLLLGSACWGRWRADTTPCSIRGWVWGYSEAPRTQGSQSRPI